LYLKKAKTFCFHKVLPSGSELRARLWLVATYSSRQVAVDDTWPIFEETRMHSLDRYFHKEQHHH